MVNHPCDLQADPSMDATSKWWLPALARLSLAGFVVGLGQVFVECLAETPWTVSIIANRS